MKKANESGIHMSASQRAGWTVSDWCASAGISDAFLYKLDDARSPSSVKVGRRRLIIEAPADWLRRMAEASAVTAP